MKYLTTILSIVLFFTWTMNAVAVDEKEVKTNKLVVKTTEKKAGLGILVSNIDEKEGDKPSEGARIIEVFEGSEAEKIGLQKGDVIVGINGNTVKKPTDLANEMEDIEEGEEVKLVILRDGEKQSVTAKLKPFEGNTYTLHMGEEDHDIMVNAMFAPGHDKDFKTIHRGDFNFSAGKKGGYLGVQVKGLSDQLKTYFEVKEGVLIEEVMKDSPAEKAGLKAGDVITAINDRKINDPEDLVRTVNYYNPEEKVELSYVRKGDNGEVNVMLGKKPAHHWSAQKAGPHSLEWISEEDHDNFFIKKGKNKKMIRVKEKGDSFDIEVEKEFFIL